MKRLVNIQNEDNECFRWCLIRYINPVDKNLAIIRKVDGEFTKQLNFKCINNLLRKKTENFEM